ncbi:glycosyltransferase [Robiginitomaculum antarcticum]|uniref:glycosyltransferase n=1 Tax=Robiginitomaculum antarcticum TaxID=437507 RepID=UPI00037A5B2B|nr:glycosyltransferase [Robiginitomaculum antarcticum]
MPKSKEKSAKKSVDVSSLPSPIIVIIGMHRSGTSALTGVLTRLGASEPNNPLPANEFNSRGYGESRGVTQLNDRMLQSVGAGWTDLAEVTKEEERILKSENFAEEILNVIKDEYAADKIIALKDPRISRIANFWSDALKQNEAFAPKYLISLRHPNEVAKSLNHRDNMNLERGLALWLRYNLDAEFQTRREVRCFVRYESLLTDWEQEFSRIKKQVELRDFNVTKKTRERVDSFLSKDLKNHESDIERSASATELVSLSEEVYEILSSAASSNKISEKHTRRLNKIRQELNFAGRVYGSLLAKTEYYARALSKELKAIQSNPIESSPADLEHINALTTEKIMLSQKLSSEAELREISENHTNQLRKAVAKGEELLKSSTHRIAYLDKQIVDANRDRARLGQTLQSALEDQPSKLLIKNLEESNLQIAEELRIFKDAKISLQSRLVEANETISSLNLKVTTFGEEKSAVERDYSELHRVNDLQNQKIDTLKGDLKDYFKKNEQLKNQIAKLKKANEGIIIANEDSREQISTLKSDLESAQTRHHNHELAIKALQSEIDSLTNNTATLSEKNKRLKSQLIDLQGEISSRQMQAIKTEANLKNLILSEAKYKAVNLDNAVFIQTLRDQLIDVEKQLKERPDNQENSSSAQSFKAENLYLSKEVERLSALNAEFSEANRRLGRKVRKRSEGRAQENGAAEYLSPEPLPEPLGVFESDNSYTVKSLPLETQALTIETEPVWIPKGDIKALDVNERQKALLSTGFDQSYYRSQCKDMGLPKDTDLLEHYLAVGASLDLSPHPLFSPTWYKQRYDDLSHLENSSYLHFLDCGAEEGRFPCPLFDTTYYRERNPDVVAHDILPHVHYYQSGWKESRNPSEWFYSQWYMQTNPSVERDGVCPLVHYMQVGEHMGLHPHPSFNPSWYKKKYLDGASAISSLGHYLEHGRLVNLPTNPQASVFSDIDRPKLLAVAHSASGRIFGSERSFLDVISSIDRSKYGVIVALPVPDPDYVKLISSHVDAVHFTKRRWWEAGTGMTESLISEYQNLIEAEKIDAVYVNTIMLREPLEAAQRSNVPGICHIREAITHDPDLIEYIGKPANEIISDVLARSDFVVGNSNATLNIFGDPSNSFLIYNSIKMEDFDKPRIARNDDTLRFGALSSNLPKKGIADIVKLAQLTSKRKLDVEFHLIGPETEETDRLKNVVKRKRLNNVVFRGYIDNVEEAIGSIDAVLNFSHFAESFGRTIAEAGAAELPSIVYDHGALPEVVDHGVTGFVIPYRRPEAALKHIEEMRRSPELMKTLGKAAKQRANDLFSHAMMKQNVNQMFDSILKDNPKFIPNERERNQFGKTIKFRTMNKDRSFSRVKRDIASVSVIVPNYNYAEYLEERLGSIFHQTVKPAQIIFLDDASPDNSVAVATELLSHQDIPFQIIANDENAGVYKQWIRGFEAATEDWIWIAEADDRCEVDFIEKLLALTDDETNIVYAESKRIGGDGEVTASNNRAHSKDVNPIRWQEDYKALGVREVLDALCFRNTIPNASAALLRRSSLHDAESVLSGLQYTGDWKLYTHLLRSGNIAYCAESLNHFRRHQKSVTRIRGKSLDYLLELANIREFMCRHFPIREKEFKRMDWFLDRDYRIDGIAKNSTMEAVAPILETSRQYTLGRKRFGFVTTNNGSYYGGSEMLWRETALSLRKKGHDVFAVIKKWEPRPEFFNEMERAGIKLLFKDEDGFEKLIKYQPDLVVVSLGDQDEGIEYYPSLVDANIPYAIVNQLTKEARFWHIRENKTEAVSKGYLDAKQTFFTCWNNQRVMESRLGTKLGNSSLHFNPYHIERSIVPTWPGETDTQIAIPSKLLFIHKGQDILAEFLGKKFWKAQNITFNFFGIGPDEQNLKDLAKRNGIENFRFHGRVDNISDIWKANHALLMPSRMEGLPIMLVSAMLSGRVPILTDIGGHAEVVDDNNSGFIASDPDAKAVEDALKRAIDRRDEWETIGNRARQDILNFLPEDPIADFITKLENIN